MGKQRKITKAEYTKFVEESKKWIEFFGLQRWEVVFKQAKMEDCYAECRRQTDCKIATLALAEEIDIKSEFGFNVEVTALHEVLHILLADIIYIAEMRSPRLDELYEREHEVINFLQGFFLQEE